MTRTKTSRRAAIAGATGLVGRELVKQLLTSPRYDVVHAVGRRAPPIEHVKLHVIDSDLQSIPPIPAIDDAFCCLGTTIRKAGSQAAFRAVDIDMVMHFAAAAQRAGARHFLVVSALGADAKSAVYYNRIKGEMEQSLIGIGFPSLYIFRPSLLVGQRTEARVGERIGIAVFSALAPMMIGPARKLRPVAAKTVAQAMHMSAGKKEAGAVVVESDAIAGLTI